MKLKIASTFVSHAWKQKPLAYNLARELNRRGVLAWIDADELPVGVDLDRELRAANEAQLTCTALISEESLASSWCNGELQPRLEAAGDDESDAVVPVYLGDPLTLVRTSPLLRARWLQPDGASVRKLGIKAGDAGDDFDAVDAAPIARRVADHHYRRLHLREASKLVLVVDQRGQGRRLGPPDVPRNWADQPWPALVFRPDRGERGEAEVLSGSAWEAFRDVICDALGDALGPRRRREVYITGRAQPSLAWLAGRCFDRSSGVKLVAHNDRGDQLLTIDLGDPKYQLPLEGVPAADVSWHAAAPDTNTAIVSAYIGSAGSFEEAVHHHRATTSDATPLALRHTGRITSIDEVIEVARWLTTVARRRALRLYTALPFHALIPLAALLKHATGPVTLMEFDRSAQTYLPCPMPRG